MSVGNSTRREFLVGAGSLAALAGCRHLPRGLTSRLGGGIRRPRPISPDEKMNVACIGIGGKGRSDTLAMAGENVVALCDVECSEKNTKKVFGKFPDAKFYRDYRKMLTEMDEQIDAVTVSTPDHTHFPAAMMAIQMGKHVFCQKPLTRTIWEARKLTEEARRHGVATQMGNQRHAGEGPRLLCEWIAAEAIGEVREVHLWTNRPSIGWGEPCGMGRPEDQPPVPESLDWDLWLGTAPARPYHPLYCPKKWRAWWDFGSGALGDMGCHIMDAAFWALDLGTPVTIRAESSPVNDETFPKWSVITYQFPQRGSLCPVKVVWYDGGKMPPRPPELEPDRKLPTGTGGQLFIGDSGTIMADAYCRSPRIIPEALMRKFLPHAPPETIPRSPGHVEEWIRACKGGEPAMSNFDYAGPLSEMVLLGNLALRYDTAIRFNSDDLTVAGLPEAQDYIRTEYRDF